MARMSTGPPTSPRARIDLHLNEFAQQFGTVALIPIGMSFDVGTDLVLLAGVDDARSPAVIAARDHTHEVADLAFGTDPKPATTRLGCPFSTPAKMA